MRSSGNKSIAFSVEKARSMSTIFRDGMKFGIFYFLERKNRHTHVGTEKPPNRIEYV